MKICQLCNQPFKVLYRHTDGKVKSLSSRKYCLDCTPFGSHNTRNLEEEYVGRVIRKPKNLELIEKLCNKCKNIRPISEYYQRQDGNGPTAYCKDCTKLQTIERQRALKLKAIEYKGGKCEDCGIIGHPAIYDFHHLDTTLKDFSIGHTKLSSFNNIKEELDKCILLCSNCHRIRHVNK